MTAAIIRAAIEAEFARSPAPPTTDDIAAAVLRAAADQVVLKCPEPKWTSGAEQARWFACNDVRDHILAIAAELEGAQADPPRHHVFPTPHQIAECGGPCEQGGPEACDCGLYERSATSSTHLEVGDE